MLGVCGLLLTVVLHVWLNSAAPLHHLAGQENAATSIRAARLQQSMLKPFKTVSRTFLTAASEAESWNVGACRMHSALLPMPAITCEPLYCLRSPVYPTEFVDVWFKAMTPNNDSSMMQSCSDAIGGQVGRVPAQPIQVCRQAYKIMATFMDVA